jgi:hypothetical protein
MTRGLKRLSHRQPLRAASALVAPPTAAPSNRRNWLFNATRLEFRPVALRMLDSAYDLHSEAFSFDYLVDCTGSIVAANRFVLSELNKMELASAQVFVAWGHPKLGMPSKEQIASVLNAPNLWVRALTVARFPDKIEKKQTVALTDQIRNHLNSQPSKEFLTLLTDLDSLRFPVRDQATKKLTLMGEQVEGMVLRTLPNSPSTEAKQRLQRVLKEMETVDPVPESFRVIRALKRIETPEEKELLKVIAEGPPGLRSTREAKKAIEGQSKRL